MNQFTIATTSTDGRKHISVFQDGRIVPAETVILKPNGAIESRWGYRLQSIYPCTKTGNGGTAPPPTKP